MNKLDWNPDRAPEYAHGGWLGDVLLLIGIVIVGTLILIVPSRAAERELIGELETSATSFCLREATQCPHPAAPAFATEAQRPLLEQARAFVAGTTIWTTDRDHYGRADWWALIRDGKGDCEDYALTERKILDIKGIPFGAMRLHAVQMQNQGWHIVLEVRFENGDVIALDNTWRKTYPADDTIYWPGPASAWGSVSGWTHNP